MCLGRPGRLLELPGPDGRARVELDGAVRDVDLVLLEAPDVAVGDWVLIHLGFALQALTSDEAAELRSTRALLHDGTTGARLDEEVHA